MVDYRSFNRWRDYRVRCGRRLRQRASRKRIRATHGLVMSKVQILIARRWLTRIMLRVMESDWPRKQRYESLHLLLDLESEAEKE